MRRVVFTLLFLWVSLGIAWCQSTLIPVIVVMAEKYDDLSLSAKTQFMSRDQRREFVINDKKAFCEASQREVLDFIQDLQVTDVRSFWSFNGFSCQASPEAIQQLVARKDVAIVLDNPEKPMVAPLEKPRPASSKDYAWHVTKVNAPQVWSYNGSTGYNGNGVVVGLIDSGVNYNHVDIANSMWDGGSEYPHHGVDIVNGDNDPMDDHGHGSHTAGIVAGQGIAGTQTGVAPGAKIMAVKVINAEGEGSDADAITGIEFAMEHGADLISMSLSIPGIGGYAIYRDVFVSCLQAGVAAAVAASNEGNTQYAQPIPYNIGAPGNCPPPWLHPDQQRQLTGGLSAVISVGATDSNDDRCDFSSVGPVTWAYGDYIGSYNDYPYLNGDATQPGLIRPDLSAPGENITSLYFVSNNNYIEMDGTSMATPCVTGVLALLLEADPELSPAQLDSIIELTSAKVGNSMKNNRIGAGRVDALAAMNALFHHGPTDLTAEYDGYEVSLSWQPAAEALTYNIFRDGIRIAGNLSTTSYKDHITYGGSYTYYVTAELSSGMTSLPSNYVTVEKEVEIAAEVINNAKVILEWNLPTCTADGFESGDFYQNMWIIDQTYPWVISNTGAHEGTYCAKSTNTAMFSTGKISLAVNVATNCLVSYYAKISCFPLNGGGFFIDNVQVGQTIKDEVPWTLYTFPLTPGNHMLEWKYANQLAEGGYENAFYIDNIMVGNPYNIYRAQCDGTNIELLAKDVASTTYVDHGWDALPIGQYMYGVSADGGANIAWSDCLNKEYMAVPETSAEVKVYPNPASSQLTVECADAQHISVVTTLGQVVYQTQATGAKTTLPLEGLPAGIYMIKIRSSQATITEKISIE